MPRTEQSRIGEFAEAVRAGRTDVRLLVPTATLAEHRRHELARQGLIFRPEWIVTLSRFATNLAQGAPHGPRQVAAPILQLLTAGVLQDVAPREFANVRDAPGFPASVAAEFERLDAAGVTPGELKRLCGEWPYAAPLARVWELVLSRLAARQLTLRTGLLRAAGQAAPAGLTVLLDGFAKFSGPERAFLKKLGAHVEEESAGESTARTERFFAATEVREAEEIARRILRAGVPFREIGIALRNPEHAVAVLRPVLERFQIPARFYVSGSLAANPAVRYLAGTVDAYLAGWDHDVCLPVLRLRPGGLPDRQDFEIRRQIPNAGLEALRGLYVETGDWETLERNWQRRSTAAGWARQLSEDLRKTYRPSKVADGLDWGTEEWERARAQALTLFEAALTETAEAWGGGEGPLTLAEFWKSARLVVEHTALRVADRRRNVVHVMSVYEARQWDLHTVFMCGLAEKAFPKRHAQDAFLPDAAVERLQRAGFGVMTSADRDREEEELFRMVRASASQHVVLSYAADGKNGPSEFWGESATGEERPAPVRPARRSRAYARRNTPRIGDAALLAWMEQRQSAFPVTALENFLGCEFKYFALNLMKLRTAPERPERRLGFIEEGNIVHKVIEEWPREGGAIRPVLDRVFESECAGLRVARGYRSEASYARMLSDLERFARTPWPKQERVSAEQKLQFAVAEGVTITARVDRIERLPDGRLVILDYKYSNAINTKNKVSDETRLQGPLYVRGIAMNGERVAAMVYFSLKKSAEAFGWGEVPGLQKQLETLTPEWVESGVAEASRAVAAIRDGRIAVLNERGEACRYCDAADACRVETRAARAMGV